MSTCLQSGFKQTNYIADASTKASCISAMSKYYLKYSYRRSVSEIHSYICVCGGGGYRYTYTHAEVATFLPLNMCLGEKHICCCVYLDMLRTVTLVYFLGVMLRCLILFILLVCLFICLFICAVYLRLQPSSNIPPSVNAAIVIFIPEDGLRPVSFSARCSVYSVLLSVIK